MIPIIGAVVSGLFGLAGDWMANRKEKAQARHERDVAIIKGKQKLAEGEQSHNSAWELEALAHASKILRAVVSATILAPIWVTMYSAEKGKEIFVTLRDTVPPEWWALFLVMCAFVYASKQLIEIIKSVKFFK